MKAKFLRGDKAEIAKFNPFLSEGETVTILSKHDKSSYMVADSNGDRWYIKTNVLTKAS